jgi:hypothetical protein
VGLLNLLRRYSYRKSDRPAARLSPRALWSDPAYRRRLHDSALAVWQARQGPQARRKAGLVLPTPAQTLAVRARPRNAHPFPRSASASTALAGFPFPGSSGSRDRGHNPCDGFCPGMHDSAGNYPPQVLAFDIDFANLGCPAISGYASMIKEREKFLCPNDLVTSCADCGECPPGYHCEDADLDCQPDAGRKCLCWDEQNFCCGQTNGGYTRGCDCVYNGFGCDPPDSSTTGATYDCSDTGCGHSCDGWGISFFPVRVGEWPGCCHQSRYATYILVAAWGRNFGVNSPTCDYGASGPCDPTGLGDGFQDNTHFFDLQHIFFFTDCVYDPYSVNGCRPCPNCDPNASGCDDPPDQLCNDSCLASRVTYTPPLDPCDEVQACNPTFAATLYGPCLSVLNVWAP